MASVSCRLRVTDLDLEAMSDISLKPQPSEGEVISDNDVGREFTGK